MRRTLLLAATLFLPLAACGDGSPSSGSGAAPSLRLDGTAELADGDTARLSVTVLDDRGQPSPQHPLGAALQWSSSATAVVAVEPDGMGHTARVRATGPGSAWIHVRSGPAADSARVVVHPAPVLQRISPWESVGTPGAPLADSVAVRVTDPRGIPLAGAEVSFLVTAGDGSVSPRTVTTGAGGVAKTRWTLGTTPGTNEVSATVTAPGGGKGPLGFRATGVAGGPGQITAISPEVLVPRGSATLQVTGLGPNPGALGVRIGGVEATVTSSTATQVTVTLPPASAYPCHSARPVTVTVGPALRSHSLRVGTPRDLAPGDALTLYGADEAQCTELAPGQYLLTAFNGATGGNAMASFRLEGGGSAAAAPAARFPAPSPAAPAAAPGPEARAEAAHLRVLEANRQTVRRLGTPRWPRGGARRSVSAAAAQVGDRMLMRVPVSGCTSFNEVMARVVHSGARAVVLEDTAAPMAGTMDEYLRRAGEEMEGRMMEILRENFGNPVALHTQEGGAGRVFLLFTPRVNAMGGSLGFVSANDFYPRFQCATSNQAPVLYALVPTGVVPESPFTGSPASWYRSMRATMIHEAKHLASIAERLTRNGELDASWLEESTARIAEEIWARDYFGGAPGSDAGYDPAVRCSARPCDGKPYVMLKHFGALYAYMRQPDVQTPLGPGSIPNSSFYGSGWSLVRWAADHSGVPEAQFFRALTHEPVHLGVRSLEEHTGRPFREMLGEWSVALATDGRPGWAPTNPRHRFPSWNLHDVFAGMSRDSAAYTRPHPLVVQPLPAAAFSVDYPGVRFGSAVHFGLEVPPTRASVRMRGAGGGPLAPTMHLAIVRIE